MPAVIRQHIRYPLLLKPEADLHRERMATSLSLLPHGLPLPKGVSGWANHVLRAARDPEMIRLGVNE
jgi:hypothetical protein